MLFIIHAEPQFVVKKDIAIYTEKGDFYLDKGRMLGLLKTEDGRLFIGTGEEGSDQLEVTGKISAKFLLEACDPATFELSIDEEGDSYIKPVFLEQKVTVTEKISRINKTDDISLSPTDILKIDYL